MDQNNQDPDFVETYGHVKKDIRRVLINNLIFIAILIALYFADKQFGFLAKIENLF